MRVAVAELFPKVLRDGYASWPYRIFLSLVHEVLSISHIPPSKKIQYTHTHSSNASVHGVGTVEQLPPLFLFASTLEDSKHQQCLSIRP